MPIVLFLVFIVVPVVELAVILRVGDLLGWRPTLVLLVVISVAGTWLVRREGMRAWSAFRVALAHRRSPTTEVVDGALVLFGGALLLTPGFITDLLGLLLVFPPTRKVLNRAIRNQARRRVLGRGRRTDVVQVIDITREPQRRGRSR